MQYKYAKHGSYIVREQLVKFRCKCILSLLLLLSTGTSLPLALLLAPLLPILLNSAGRAIHHEEGDALLLLPLFLHFELHNNLLVHGFLLAIAHHEGCLFLLNLFILILEYETFKVLLNHIRIELLQQRLKLNYQLISGNNILTGFLNFLKLLYLLHATCVLLLTMNVLHERLVLITSLLQFHLQLLLFS